MKFERSGGILLHPTSLPGKYGIGELGAEAYAFVDWLASTGCTLWQILPLGPTGYGDSPYQCFSAFAGNPYLISLVKLRDQGLLDAADLAEAPEFGENVDFGRLIPWKLGLLNRAFENFRSQSETDSYLSYELERFQNENASWLDDFTLFMALKEGNGGGAWSGWDVSLRQRDPEALAAARQTYLRDIQRHSFYQYLFFQQWNSLRAYANERNIKIIGDIPIFIAYDSADVWSNPELFYLDENSLPSVVAGVPPDYFSPTGQLWGNPLYRWEAHKETGYAWWLERFRAVLKLVDIVRLDHFRGFAAYFEIQAGQPTAEYGRWVTGPGADLFQAIKAGLGELPIIAEDLGLITEDVMALRDEFNLPGMKILQFGFSNPKDPFLPHNYISNCVAYTGTHDNDTAVGWFESAPESERTFALSYLDSTAQDFAWDLIRAVWSSVAAYALAPMQDLLGLDTAARMNYPSRLGGNWEWRVREADLTPELAQRLKQFNYMYFR